ncbi:MAG: Rod shape-determining protein mreB [candidate division WS6 bacterium GW2011_GWF2_39_15]|uniref:Cell shape-determining protein MreB n=1 Tax=candidate division WS6 bacterium GW2011_GWF2_39_15 TaxID=1619100 RepID=A0A0G0Q7F2_9BACT|nr:MAG: Rod shape-determining protein mreB [candidate division WS6 bacterium GW2011_GWF2_39_15]
MNILSSLLELITYDIGIDLGTANTMVYLRGKGIVVSEPSVVAIDKKTNRVLAVGKEARQMIGRTPANVVAVRPLRDGVITDFDTTQAMIHHFINKAHSYVAKSFKIPKPRVIVGVPSSVTEVERQAVIDACKTAGAREVFIVEEAMAAAIGAGLPVEQASGSMIVDIGGGTSDIAVLSLGDLVVDKTIKIAGDEMDQDIVNYVRDKYNMLIGERTAEDVKIAIGSAAPLQEEQSVIVQGRDLISGLPKSVEFSSVEVREAILSSIDQITDAVKDAIEETPPELLTDLLTSGLNLTGGGALIPGLDKLWQSELNIPVNIVNDPMSTVARGTALMLDHIELLERIQRSWNEII